MVGAGAVVTRDVPPLAIVAGNPARIIGYVGAVAAPGAAKIAVPPAEISCVATSVAGVTLHRLPFVEDLRHAHGR